MIINGKRIHSEYCFAVKNPYTNQVIEDVVDGSSKNIKLAINETFKFKCSLSINEKKQILGKTAIYLKDNIDKISNIITSETGLSLKDSIYEVGRVINCAKFSIKVCEEVNKDITNNFIFDENDPELTVIKEPLDLVLAITPFNHPMNQVAHKIFPAIIAGSSVILKPSEKTPLSAMALVEILIKCGLPNNMINVVTAKSGTKVLSEILKHKKIDMVTFTGGYSAGIDIKNSLINNDMHLVKYVPELGGSSALIISEDADISKAVEITINGCFKNSGQRCTSIRRIILENKIADDFIKLLLKKVQNIKYGNPVSKDTDMGTVIDEDSAIKIQNRIILAISNGATLIFGNERTGALLSPTILDNVTVEMDIIKKETFGPVCSIIRSDNFEESIKLAGNTEYHLAGGIVTNDEEKAKMASQSLKVGQFSINGAPSYRTEVAPFGGFGKSGNGEKEGILLAASGMLKIRTVYMHKIK